MAERPKSRAAGTVKRTRKETPPVDEAPRPSAARAGGKAKPTPKAERPGSPATEKAKRTRKTSSADETRADLAPRRGKPRPTAERPESRTTKRTRKKSTRAPAAPRPSPHGRKAPPTLPYLAAELGQPVDHEGEPIGAGSRMVRSDTALQEYTLQLWRQMQSGRGINKHLRAVERAGLNIDDVWMAGITETLSTSSTPDEARRYRQKLLFRANLLEAILSETVAKLLRLDRERADTVEDGKRAGLEGEGEHVRPRT